MQPLRCWTCGRALHVVAKALEQTTETGRNLTDILDEFKVHRYCCRRFALCDLSRVENTSNGCTLETSDASPDEAASELRSS